MEIITYNGQRVTKPIGFKHEPSVKHTIKPVQRIPFDLWGECIRAELKALYNGRKSGVNDVVLVKEYHL